MTTDDKEKKWPEPYISEEGEVRYTESALRITKVSVRLKKKMGIEARITYIEILDINWQQHRIIFDNSNA